MRAWLPPALYALLILAASSVPSQALPRSSVWSADKLIHAVEYAIFGALLARALWLGTRWPVRVRLGVAFAAAALFGLADEAYQRLTPGRFSSIWDAAADAAGAAIGVALVWSWIRRREHGDHSELRRRRTESR